MKQALVLAVMLAAGFWSGDVLGKTPAGFEAFEAAVRVDGEANPAMYEAVAAARAEVVKLDGQKRGRIAIVGPMLDALGPQAMVPMLAELLEDRPFEGARPTVRRAWRVGLLFALGRMRNVEARAVLEHVVRTEPDVEVLTSAAEALGKLQDADAAKALMAAANGQSERHVAILRGMGQCRRTEMATYLAARLGTATGDELKANIWALREAGNSWAWRTVAVAKSGEGAEVREIATRALLDAWLRHPELRNDLRKAVLVVDGPEVVALVEAMGPGLTGKDKVDYERLLRSVRDNPLHKRRK